MNANSDHYEEVFQNLWKVNSTPDAWLEIFYNKMPTRNKLLIVGIPIKSLVYVFYKSSVESVRLVFICVVASQIWKMCDNWFGVNSVHHTLFRFP